MQFLLEILIIIGFSNDLVINCESRTGEHQMTLSCLLIGCLQTLFCLLLQYLQNTTSFSPKLPFARESPSGCILHLNAFGLCGCSNCRGLLKQQSYTGAYTEPCRTHKTHIQSSQCAAGLQAFVHLFCAVCGWVAALGYPHQPASAFTHCTSSAHSISPSHPAQETHAFFMQMSQDKNIRAQYRDQKEVVLQVFRNSKIKRGITQFSQNFL